MTLLVMAVPGFLGLASGPGWVRPVTATSAALLCTGLAAWLLGRRDHVARRARLLFRDDTAAVQGLPYRAGKRGIGGGVRERRGHRASGKAESSGAAKDTLSTAWPSERQPREVRPKGESVAGCQFKRAGRPGATGVGGYRIGIGPPSWRYGPPLQWAKGSLRRAGRRGAWCLVGGTAMAILGDSLLPLLLGLTALPVARRAAKASEARQTRERRADAVITLCGALAGEVRAGHHAGEALLAVVRDSDGLAMAQAAVVAAARFGGDVPRALASAAREPGAEGLLGLAACWRVAMDSGAGLAAGLERLEGTLRADRNQRAELRAQLAGARSTAVLLAGLPALGLLLGAALGADPLHVLLHSGAGLGCLLVGGVLESAGLCWALRIVRNGEGE